VLGEALLRKRAHVVAHLAQLADPFAIADPDQRFELLLDLFVDGLARRAT
jgi:hypothetical protein